MYAEGQIDLGLRCAPRVCSGDVCPYVFDNSPTLPVYKRPSPALFASTAPVSPTLLCSFCTRGVDATNYARSQSALAYHCAARRLCMLSWQAPRPDYCAGRFALQSAHLPLCVICAPISCTSAKTQPIPTLSPAAPSGIHISSTADAVLRVQRSPSRVALRACPSAASVYRACAHRCVCLSRVHLSLPTPFCALAGCCAEARLLSLAFAAPGGALRATEFSGFMRFTLSPWGEHHRHTPLHIGIHNNIQISSQKIHPWIYPGFSYNEGCWCVVHPTGYVDLSFSRHHTVTCNFRPVHILVSPTNFSAGDAVRY